jgi:PKHD-type hydroxylase
MLLTLSQVLSTQELNQINHLIELSQSEWADGKHTAGVQSAQVKNNWQLPESTKHLQALRQIVCQALMRHPQFVSATLPKMIFPPLFNQYEGENNHFGWHVDGSMRPIPPNTLSTDKIYLRTDISCTLFLSSPTEYEGGELEIEDTFATQLIKLGAGDLVVYPSTSIHQVRKVTHGRRVACFFWIESMVRDTQNRRLLYEMDMALLQLRESMGEKDAVVRLTGIYHNLLRQWADA